MSVVISDSQLLAEALEVLMRRIAATFSLVLILLVTLLVGAAAADPLNKPTYTLQCGSTTYTVVSPDVAVTGSDVNSTSQLIVAIGNVPERLLTFCTATPVGGGESFEAFFLITPAR